MIEDGASEFLTPEERKELQRLLSSPEEFPREFGAWIRDYIAVNGEVARSQVVGLAMFTAKQEVSAASGTISGTTYGNLTPNIGPTLEGLAAGTYVVMFGADMTAQAAGKTCYMSVSVNGAAAADADAVNYYNGPGPGWGSAQPMRTLIKTVDKPSNTIQAKYRSQDATTCQYTYPWIVALRLS